MSPYEKVRVPWLKVSHCVCHFLYIKRLQKQFKSEKSAQDRVDDGGKIK